MWEATGLVIPISDDRSAALISAALMMVLGVAVVALLPGNSRRG
jgi:hypothetical protein